MKANCHCGNVQINTSYIPNEVAQCNCSICRRYSACWAYFDPEDVVIQFEKEISLFYIWGDKEVEFHRCGLCGCVTHYITTAKCKDRITAINMRMTTSEMLDSLPVRKIDGDKY